MTQRPTPLRRHSTFRRGLVAVAAIVVLSAAAASTQALATDEDVVAAPAIALPVMTFEGSD